MNSNFKTVMTVMRKELRDFIRDRKTFMMTVLLSPLLYPLIFIGIGTLVDKRMNTELEKSLTIPVQGAEHAPNLVTYLRSRGIEVKPATDAQISASIRDQSQDIGLVIDKDFAAAWRAGKSAKVEVLRDSTRKDAKIPSERVRVALEGYGQTVGAMRLVARGISPELAKPINPATRDLATAAAKRSGFVSAILPLILTLLAFIGGAHLSMDTTAGERERQSLEPLLATPATRGALVSGKMLAASSIGVLGLFLTLLAFKVTAMLSTSGIGKTMDVSLPAIAQLLLVLLPLVLIGTALLSFLAAGAKSMKEAQSNMVWLMFLPMLPAYALMAWPLKDTDLWQYAVPFLSQNQMIQKITRSDAPAPEQWALYLASALALALVLWLAAVWRYRQEKLAISA